MEGNFQLIHGDCLEILPTLAAGSVDAVITDPPYPDYHVDLYGIVDISLLNSFDCRQLVFWSAKCEFPLDYSAIHIWDKMIGTGSQYERIFEINGDGGNWKLYSVNSINNSVRAMFASDKLYGHPSQKPRKLIAKLLEDFTNPGDTILDPFMGSGTTGVACAQTGRNFIGIEIDEGYFKIAEKRINKARQQLRLGI